MSPAGDNVGKAARSGVRTLKRNAARAQQAGVETASRLGEVAEQKLTERGLAPQQLAEAVAENAAVVGGEVVKTTRRARKKIEKNTKRTRKDLAKSAKKAGKQAGKRAAKAGKELRGKVDKKAAKAEAKLQKKLAKEQRGRRRWPFVVGLGVAAAAVYVIRSKSSSEVAPLEQDTLGSRTPAAPPAGAPEQNGQHSPTSTQTSEQPRG